MMFVLIYVSEVRDLDSLDEGCTIYSCNCCCLLWLVAGGWYLHGYYCLRSSDMYEICCVNPLGRLHREAVLRIMKYLQGTAGYGSICRSEMNSSSRIKHWVIERNLVSHPGTRFSAACDSLNLYAYVDADHGRDI